MEWIKSSFSFANGNCVQISWLKSSYSDISFACVEVSGVPEGYVPSKEGTRVLVRDSKDPDGPVLEFSRDEWDAFLAGVRNGEFDDMGRAGTVQEAAATLKHAVI